MTLIHLISQERLQNILPLLALRPDKVIQVKTAHVDFNFTADHIEKAANEAGLSAHFESVTLPQNSPNIEEARVAIADLLRTDSNATVNFTGSTKMVSIGAYLAARHAGAPTLYCDTREKKFFDGGTGALPEMRAFEEVLPQVTVRLLMCAHGKDPNSWKSEPAPDNLIEFGKNAYPVWERHSAQLTDWVHQHLRERFKRSERILPLGELRTKVQQPLNVPPDGPVREYFRIAVDAGLVASTEDDFKLAVNIAASGDDLKKSCSKILQMLEGSWLELYCLSVLRSSKRYADVYWSLKPEKGSTLDFGETDIICVDKTTLGLTVISAKNSLPRLEHVEAHARRATTIGGSHAAALICATPSPKNQSSKEIDARVQQARSLRCPILCWDEIAKSLGGAPING